MSVKVTIFAYQLLPVLNGLQVLFLSIFDLSLLLKVRFNRLILLIEIIHILNGESFSYFLKNAVTSTAFLCIMTFAATPLHILTVYIYTVHSLGVPLNVNVPSKFNYCWSTDIHVS